MKRITTAYLAAYAMGCPLFAPMYDEPAPHVRTAKPTGHGRPCKRPLSERMARRAKRRQRAGK